MERGELDSLDEPGLMEAQRIAGAKGLTLDLDRQSHKYNRKTVAASTKRQSLVAKASREFKATTGSAPNLPVAPHLLRQDFSADAPD